MSEIMNYHPATLHENKEWMIVYQVRHPETGKMVRKRVRCSRVKNVKDRRLWAKKMIMELNKKLDAGWNPFIDIDSSRQYHSIGEVLDTFLRDKRGLRKDTLRTYNSEVKFLKEYIELKYELEMYAVSFDKMMALKYMENAWINREIKARRYNNILAICRLIFNWMIDKQYVKKNPFENIKKKKVGSKIRVMDIDKADRKKIRDYLAKTNRPYLVAMMFAFHSLLRPKEISYIKIADIDTIKQVVTVRAAVAKNGKQRDAPMPDVMIDFVKELLETVHGSRKTWYLFSENFKPGKVRRDSREIARYWSDLRKTLRFDKDIQFYSLRDSGIIQMIRDGRSPKEVMEAADHSSIEITNKYVKVARKESDRDIINKSSAF